MAQSKTKPVQPIKTDRKPKTNPTEISAPAQSAEPPKRWNDIRDRATKKLSQYPEFADLEDLDLMCVLALVELLSYGGHNVETIEDASNWVGAVVTEILFKVARTGPASVNARPGDVKECFDRAVENLRDTMSLCRRLGSAIPPSALDEIENWNAPEKSSAAGGAA
jgi:hypothetical protein